MKVPLLALKPFQFNHALRALGLTTPVVLVQNSERATENTLIHFTRHLLVKPVGQAEMYNVFLQILDDTIITSQR